MRVGSKVLGEPVEGSLEKYLEKTRQESRVRTPVVVPRADGGIDPECADGLRTHLGWIDYFNIRKKRMISAPDIYRAAQTESEELLDSLRNDFNQKGIVTSTRIFYNPDKLEATICHNTGSSVINPTKLQTVVPVYKGTLLSGALKSKETADYLQALFDTKDDDVEIAVALERLTQLTPDRIKLWTPYQASRKSLSDRTISFVVDSNGFHITDYYDIGYSRGVTVKK